MSFPLESTVWPDNPYQKEWAAQDYMHTPDGIGSFPKHHCKKTYLLSKKYIKRFRNAVDVGCRVGEYSRYLHLDFKHVYAFDPNLWPAFRFNVDLSRVTHFNCALGDIQSKIKMYGGMHTLRPEIEAKMHRCFTLDQFNLQDIDYLKIDVEGFEKKVLLGARDTIEKYNPVIVIEQNHVIIEGGRQFDALEYIQSIGYEKAAADERGWDLIMVRNR